MELQIQNGKRALFYLMLIMCLPLYGEQTFKSRSGHVSLIELYTSEGCSSCPPADRVFTSLTANGGLWSVFVPVAFHVDYWNTPWRDPLSASEFTSRQAAYGRGLVTPDLVVNGERSSAWNQISQGAYSNSNQTGTLVVRHENDQRYAIVFQPTSKMNQGLVAHVALLGFGISYDVTSGENAGKTLTHDFAVLSIDSANLNHADGYYTGIAELPLQKLKHPVGE